MRPELAVQSEEARIRRQNEEDSVLNGLLDFAKERYNICKTCEAFNNQVKVCAECYCFMPAKVILKFAKCPIDKWSQVE